MYVGSHACPAKSGINTTMTSILEAHVEIKHYLNKN